VHHIGLGPYFIFLRTAVLPDDTHYMGAELPLRAVAPGDWLRKVFTVVGGLFELRTFTRLIQIKGVEVHDFYR